MSDITKIKVGLKYRDFHSNNEENKMVEQKLAEDVNKELEACQKCMDEYQCMDEYLKEAYKTKWEVDEIGCQRCYWDKINSMTRSAPKES